MAKLDHGTEIILYMLYVHPERKGHGTGSALLHAIIGEYPDARAIPLEVLKDNTAAIEWYKAKGFKIYGETQNATATTNVAAFYMDKKLGPLTA